MCKRYVQGKNLWIWIRRIAMLKAKKIGWDENMDDPTSQIYIVTVNGTYFKVWEKKHPMLPYDKSQFSHTFNHGALKYEIAIDVYQLKVVWINGPHRGGKHDKVIFHHKGLFNKIRPGKKQ
jgi:hypothetical protein